MNLDWITILTTIVAFIVGTFLKQKPWYNTKFIPIATVVVAVVVRLGVALGIGVASADSLTVATGTAIAGFSWGAAGTWLLMRVIEAAIATGCYSGTKNIKEGLGQGSKVHIVK